MSFTDKTAVPGTQYSYHARATDGTNTGPLSASVAVTTARKPQPTRPLSLGQVPVRTGGLTATVRRSAPTALRATTWNWSYGGPAFAGDTGAIANDTSRSTTFNGARSTFAYRPEPGQCTHRLQRGGVVQDEHDPGRENLRLRQWPARPARYQSRTQQQLQQNLYMTGNQGTLSVPRISSNGTRTVSSVLPYNDNAWHHAVATQGSDGMRLYVDGTQIGALPNQTAAQSYWGSWKIGGDQLNSWPLRPSSNYFAGSIDEFAVYPTVAFGGAGHRPLQHRQGNRTAGPRHTSSRGRDGIAAAVTASDVAVSWNETTDNVGVTEYQVHRSDTSGFTPSAASLVATLNGSTLSWIDAGRPAGTSYYQVLAADEAGNVSGPSNEASATVVPLPQPVTLTLTPTADTYVNAGAPNTATGSFTTLATRGTSAYITYMRFNASSQVPAGQHACVSATLKFSTTADSFAGSADPQQTVAMAGDWSEATTTYNNRPQTSSTLLGTLTGPTAPNASYSISLDAAAISAALAGDINFSMQSAGTDNMWFFSREATAVKRPALVLNFEPNP